MFGASLTDREDLSSCPNCTGVKFPPIRVLPFIIGRKHRWGAQFVVVDASCCPYADIPKKTWNTKLASVNPVNSEVKKSQPAQPEKPKARVYGSTAEVWPYGLLPAGHMGEKVQVPCVYNYPPLGIRQLTINDLSTL